MPRYRQELEQIERQTLAPFAQFSGDTRGRAHREEPPLWRTQFQRDRDRVIHSRAFRRLEYKTQVFLNGTGDHLRTRLTHTMEVAAISRNIASALRLNTDLAETIALAHDLGHSPFGHKGETVLNQLMVGHGGFEHNHHSLRIVEELEQKYPNFSGLNLSWEVLEGLAKHQTAFDRPGVKKGFIAKNPSLEAQIANLADEITYYSHDLDDGIDSGLLSEKELHKYVRIWAQAAQSVKKKHGNLPEEGRRYFIIRTIIDMQISDVLATSERLITSARVRSVDDVRRFAKPLIQYSPERRKLNIELRKYLYKNLYFNEVVNEPHVRAKQLLRDLFGHYLKHPKEIGDQARKQIRKLGIHRAICDYIAGMTDRYAIAEHKKFFGDKLKFG
ncbi:MAG TPA: deoxyguanosinetriphosphate triphosphohydrolase [Candidatus Acidoferrales bacterium]|nr:deoxyguanosinetriphosphate triphosphohydrolase [Candidatus Acidoferrales bacterium]